MLTGTYFSRKYASILVGYETLQEIGDRDSLAHKFKETHSYEHGEAFDNSVRIRAQNSTEP